MPCRILTLEGEYTGGDICARAGRARARLVLDACRSAVRTICSSCLEMSEDFLAHYAMLRTQQSRNVMVCTDRFMTWCSSMPPASSPGVREGLLGSPRGFNGDEGEDGHGGNARGEGGGSDEDGEPTAPPFRPVEFLRDSANMMLRSLCLQSSLWALCICCRYVVCVTWYVVRACVASRRF